MVTEYKRLYNLGYGVLSLDPELFLESFVKLLRLIVIAQFNLHVHPCACSTSLSIGNSLVFKTNKNVIKMLDMSYITLDRLL